MMSNEEYIRLFIDIFCLYREDIQNRLLSK